MVQRRFNYTRYKVVLLVLVTASYLVLIISNKVLFLEKDNRDSVYDDVQVYRRTTQKNPLLHLDSIDPRMHLMESGFENIDTVHRNGLIHMGGWIHIIDTSLTSKNEPRILMIKRKNDLVTCPGKWSLVGEHAFRDESPLDTVRRGIKEELGSRFLDYIDTHGSITKLMDLPVYFELDYGPSRIGRRIDKQVTYMWLVETSLERKGKFDSEIHTEKIIEFDHEVADHVWKPLSEAEKWLDDDKKSFCHEKISNLMKLGFRALNSKRKFKSK